MSDSAESSMDGKAVNLNWHMTESAGVCARLEYMILLVRVDNDNKVAPSQK